MTRVSIIQTEKTTNETLADLRKLFREWKVEDWEPIPGEDGRSYAVRYLRGKQWATISSTVQPTKAMNLRVCLQVLSSLKLWENRGVSGVSQGVTFFGAALVSTGADAERENYEESCAVLGVDPDASIDEVEKVYQAKVRFAHPDTGGSGDRFKRLNKAYEYIKKVKAK